MIVEETSNGLVSSDVHDVPHSRVGLVFGTAKWVVGGGPNLFFKYRMEAAEKLYRSGKVDRLLISGDNSQLYYNEPQMMKESLVERGIPEEHIILDYAGFDTYDSVIRANKVFGQDTIIVISQEFQNRRAVYIAQAHGIKAYGFNARDVARWGGLKTKLREYLARTKAVAEVWMNVQPTFLGEKIEIQ